MNILKQRFKSIEEKNEFNQSNPRPISFQQEQEVVKLADQSCYKLLNAFTNLEYSLAKLVLHSLGLDADKEVWKAKHEIYRTKLSKIFSIHEIREIIGEFEKVGIIKANEELNNIQLPTHFKTDKKVSYLEALRIAFEYRNNIAHEGYIFFYFKHQDKFKINPIILAKEHQIKKGYPNIPLLERSIIDEAGKCIHLSFMDFVGRLLLGLPPHGVTSMRYEIIGNPDIELFLDKRVKKAEGTMKSLLKSKLKKIEKFTNEIIEDYKKE